MTMIFITHSLKTQFNFGKHISIFKNTIQFQNTIQFKKHNTQINTFHENEAETCSPREVTKFRPNFDQDLRRQPFVGGFPYISSLSYSRRRTEFLP